MLSDISSVKRTSSEGIPDASKKASRVAKASAYLLYVSIEKISSNFLGDMANSKNLSQICLPASAGLSGKLSMNSSSKIINLLYI